MEKPMENLMEKFRPETRLKLSRFWFSQAVPGGHRGVAQRAPTTFPILGRTLSQLQKLDS